MKVENFKHTGTVAGFQVYNVTPVPGGDSYLFVDDSVTFVYDTGFCFSSEMLVENIKQVLGDRPLDYILVTHSHYDHAFGSAALSIHFPGSKVVASSYAAYVFTREGAKRTMVRLDDIEAKRQGYEPMTKYVNDLHVDIEVEDGSVLTLGKHEVEIMALPGHTNDCVGYWFKDKGLFLSCETLGLLASDDLVIPCALVGFQKALDSIERVSKMDIKYYFIPHQGMVDDYKRFLKLSVEGHLLSRDMIIEGYKKGLSQEEMVQQYLDVFYLDKCKEVYPLAAAYENLNIMIPKILKEEGY
ncbi:MAG: MBL fold metallo-hydrolase [Erysipelotrichaceae bacterium]|nr:MBL fold metallo-hydrolase [Erysipelotrichaceae bacterium]